MNICFNIPLLHINLCFCDFSSEPSVWFPHYELDKKFNTYSLIHLCKNHDFMLFCKLTFNSENSLLRTTWQVFLFCDLLFCGPDGFHFLTPYYTCNLPYSSHKQDLNSPQMLGLDLTQGNHTHG